MAKAAKKKSEGSDDDVVIALPVKLGTKSTSTKKISFQATIPRENIVLTKADNLLTFRRVKATLAVGKVAAQTAGNQKKLPELEDVDHEITSVIQTSKLGVTDDCYTVTLNFSLKEIKSESKLEGFAGRDGLLTIHSVDDITADELKEAKAEDSDAKKE